MAVDTTDPDFGDNVSPIRPGLGLRDNVGSALKSGGGGGTSDGMEARVARLEVDVDYIKRDVAELRTDVRGLRDDVSGLKVSFARLEERVAHLPGKGFIVSALVTSIGLLTAIIVLADKIKALVGVAH